MVVGQPRRKETNAQLKAADAENLVLPKFQMWLKYNLVANVSCLNIRILPMAGWP